MVSVFMRTLVEQPVPPGRLGGPQQQYGNETDTHGQQWYRPLCGAQSGLNPHPVQEEMKHGQDGKAKGDGKVNFSPVIPAHAEESNRSVLLIQAEFQQQSRADQPARQPVNLSKIPMNSRSCASVNTRPLPPSSIRRNGQRNIVGSLLNNAKFRGMIP